MKTRWSNVPGEWSIEFCSCDEHGILGAELVISFVSSGYDQPMSMYGGPDRLGWPAEHEDERTFESAELRIYLPSVNGATLVRTHVLDDTLGAALFELFRDKIEEVVLEWDPAIREPEDE